MGDRRGIVVGFDAFFKSGAGNHRAYPYQVRSAEHAWPETLVVPTGFGKTAAVLAAWLWKIGRGDAETPRRLVYCLPMRTLVEQTESAAKRWIDTARSVLGLEVNLDVLMGGRSEGRRGLPQWMLYPERPAILIGTQDILISAALMRGYQVLARRVRLGCAALWRRKDFRHPRRTRLGLIEARSSDTDAGLMATGIRGRRATRVFSVRRMGKSMGNTNSSINMHLNFSILVVIVAEREGFEPSIRFPAYTLSKRAP